MRRFEFPEGVVGDRRDEWVGFEYYAGWLEVECRHLVLSLGPFAIVLGGWLTTDWRPRRPKSKRRIARETAAYRLKQSEWGAKWRKRQANA